MGFLFNLDQLPQDEKKKMLVFIVDKYTKRIITSTEDLILKLMSCQGVKVGPIIVGTSNALLDVLLPIKDTVTFAMTTLEFKGLIFKVEYQERRRTSVAVYEVPGYLINENIAAYMF